MWTLRIALCLLALAGCEESESPEEAAYGLEAAALEGELLGFSRGGEEAQGEERDRVAAEYVAKVLQSPKKEDRFQAGKFVEAMMRRKMYTDSPSCEIPEPGEGAAAPRPRGVIVFLLVELHGQQETSHAEDLRRDLALAMRCWARHLPGYPMLVFHTPEVASATLESLAAEVLPVLQEGTGLEFATIEATFPLQIAAVGADAFFEGRCLNASGADRWREAQECGCECGAMDLRIGLQGKCWRLGWMHSMRLATAEIFRHPALASGDRFDYVAVVNADLFLAQPPPLDPFRLLAHCGCALAYDRFSLEIPGCFENFLERLYELRVNHPNMVGGPAAIGGQLLVARLSLLTSPHYLRLADELADGIYLHRWGDQLFFAAALQALQESGGDPAWGGAEDPAVRDYGATFGACLHEMFWDLFEPRDLEAGAVFLHQRGSWRDERLQQMCAG